MRYIVFDTETPNSRNDRMSQIGLCVVEDGRVTWQFSSLVDPECEFEPFNIMLTGITPEMASRAPCFATLWRSTLEDIFSDGRLVAHNAPFDMAVLAKCLAAYGIRWRRTAEYIDTVRVARRAFPRLPNHKLNTVSDWLGLELDHHDAGSDALACAGILLASGTAGVDVGEFVRTYDLAARKTLTAV